jgi:hypothetical protein
MRFVCVALLFVAGCSAVEAQTPRPPPESRCRVDSDCIVVDAMPACGPCGTCGDVPRAVSARWVRQQARACATQRRRADAERHGGPRPQPPRCGPCPPPPREASFSYSAACRDHVCEAFVDDAGDAPQSIDTLIAPGR